MLVLSRERNEVIEIQCPDGTLIEIAIVDIRGDKVRVGLDAPKDYIIHRREVANAIREEQAEDGYDKHKDTKASKSRNRTNR
jgi:carbon storage regulator